MRSKHALGVVERYLTLVQDLTPRPTPGLVRLYALRAACGIASASPETLCRQLDLLGETQRADQLCAFANASIIENILVYADLMIRVIACEMKHREVRSREAMSPPPRPFPTLSAQTLEALQAVMRRASQGLDRRDLYPGRIENDLPDDSMNTAACAALLDAGAMKPGFQRSAQDEIVQSFCRAVPDLLRFHQSAPIRRVHVPMLRLLFAIACVYAEVSPASLRRPTPSPLRRVCIADTTLAALPLPSRELIELCAEPSGVISQKGQDYVHCLTAYAGLSPL